MGERERVIFWIRFLCGALGLILLGCAGVHVYRHWREKHLVVQMEQFVRQNDLPSAALVARRLLAIDQDHLIACRAMAEMAERANRIEALSWRKRITQLNPGVAADQLALARTALHFGQTDIADSALSSLPENARQGVEFHQVAGAICLVRQQMDKAEKHFSAALETAPKDTHLALNLALLRLTSRDENIASVARQTLLGLTNDAAVRVEALRALAADALAHNDRGHAEEWARALHAEPQSTFSDGLIYFDAIRKTERAPAALQSLQDEAAHAADKTAALITWLNRHELAQNALDWSATLPKEIAQAHPVPLAIAESYSFLENWNGLRDHVTGKNWGNNEALRLAVLSHALHRLGSNDEVSMEAQTAWRSALKTAQAHPEQLIVMAQLAEGWNYAAEAEEAWWSVANNNDNTRMALTALQRLCKARQNTRGLLRVAQRAYELNPKDLVAANNCASLGLLVNGDSTSRRLALKLHNEYPDNRAFTATYAFALHTEGKSAEGLRLMEKLSERDLHSPGLAAYYVLLLVENGKVERARSFLIEAERANLLPEERQLLSAAARKITESENGFAKM